MTEANFIVQRGRPVFVARLPVLALADFVRHLPPVQQLVVREQAAAPRLDLQRRARPIDRALQPAETLPDRPRLARIGIRIRLRHELGRQ
jgi:hypothetical protein